MRYFITAFLLLQTIFLWSQPDPCGPNPEMTSTCASACVICDIDGFTGVNDLSIVGQNVPGFCTTFQHNIQFIAFIAGTENLTIQVEVGDCVGGGQSLELGFFESLDCETFTPITDCDTDIDQFTTQTFTNDVPLIVGQHYYMIIDGSGSANCEWTFNVLDGSTEVLPLTTSGVIDHLDEICPETATTFFTTGDVGAALFFWTIDGVPHSEITQTVDLSFPTDGLYEVCVTAANVCDQAPPSCTTINVRTVEDLIIEERLCESECVIVNNVEYCETGEFVEVITLPNGCDSTVYISLVEVPTNFTNFDVWICNDQTFTVGNSIYDQTGSYIDTVLTVDECDSLIFTELLVIECEINISPSAIPVICQGDASGILVFTIDQGTPPFNYTYSNIADATITGVGSTSLLNDNQIVGLPAGNYQIYVEDSFGNDAVILQEITEPTAIQIDFIPSDFGGFNVSCFDNIGSSIGDGTLEAVVTGGVPPYQYLWNTGETQSIADQLDAGTFTVSVTDATTCEMTASFIMLAPPPIDPMVDFIDPSCEGFESGEIVINEVNGGVMPYTFSLDNNQFSSDTIFEDLLEGTYTVFIQDSNGCVTSIDGSITAPQIPVINLPNDLTIALGDSIQIMPGLNGIDVLVFAWTPLEYLSCNDCFEPITSAVNNTTYTLSVTSIDDCTDDAQINIIIDKRRRVYIPNVFSPNGDGVNDIFFINAGPEAASIDLYIFDRWGNQVFKTTDALLNEPANGWDGRFSGQKGSSGVYTWAAKILFIDGIEVDYAGSITLI